MDAEVYRSYYLSAASYTFSSGYEGQREDHLFLSRSFLLTGMSEPYRVTGLNEPICPISPNSISTNQTTIKIIGTESRSVASNRHGGITSNEMRLVLVNIMGDVHWPFDLHVEDASCIPLYFAFVCLAQDN